MTPSKCIAMIALFGSTFFAQSARAQQEPDYSNVNDILDGRRTLVEVDDLVVVGLQPPNPTMSTFILPTTNSQLDPVKTVLPQYNLPATSRFKNLTGHMFNFPSATTVALEQAPPRLWFPLLSPPPVDTPLKESGSFTGVMADFNQDGYDDLLLNSNLGSTVVATAANVNNFGASPLKFGPVNTLDALQEIVAGDFNGDGQMEVAGLSKLASGELALVIYTVDPKTLEIARASQITLKAAGGSKSEPVTHMSIASGRFTAAAHDQLVLAFATVNGQTSLETIDFAPSSLQPEEKSTFKTFSQPRPNGLIRVKTGRFNFRSQYDQIVFFFAWHGDPRPNGQGANTKYVHLVTVDPVTLDMTRKQIYEFSNQDCAYDISLGNYDHQQPDPIHKGKTEHDPNPQIALLFGSCGSGGKGLNILNVDLADFSLNAASASALPSELNSLTSLSFTASDTQGRSYILGEPSKVVVTETAQPSVIAAMPPMHVDFIRPVGSQDPTVLNLSAIPDGFRTEYETNETKTKQSSTTNTDSWSFGAKQTIGASLEFGDVEAGNGLNIENTFTAAQDLKGNIEKEHGSYSSEEFNANVGTGFADQVWYTESRFNIYVYPVIGKTVCPAAKPNCQNSEKLPLTLQFSAPDKIESERIAGNLIPWYQPPWEPGNVFSYPASYAQLQQIVPEIDKLSNAETAFTDASTSTEKATWKKEATEGASTSFDQNYSFENDLSVTGAVGVPGLSFGANVSLNLSGSFGFSNLNKSVTTVGKSAGIGVTKPGSFAVPAHYAYPFTPYIFGQKKPGGVLDNEPLNSDIQTFGLLRTAFVADPARNIAGGWWKQAYTSAPDVGLNHPSRWLMSEIAVENPIPANCLNVGFGSSNMDCARLAPSSPNNPWVSLFHVMRGFFISNALNPGSGPQLTTAKAGDKLTLQARVYNYSLAHMPADSSVHVRFYVQPWNANNHSPVGGSGLINNEDVVLSAIPPFSDEGDAPLNWVLASTTFDTTPYGNQYLTFWVVVWIEDGNGKLVPEIASHGLKSIPGPLKSLADVQTEEYSNNLGFYNSEFYVFPRESSGAGTPPNSEASSVGGEPAAIDIGKIQLSTARALPGQTIDVSAELSAENNSASGVTAIFYDGDPHAGGTAFGLERSPFIAESGTYQVKAPYYVRACGVHELFIVVHKDTPEEILRRAPPVRIDCASPFSPARR